MRLTSASLATLATRMENAAGASTAANATTAGYWKRIALAVETLRGSSTAGNDSTEGWQQRAAAGLEGLHGGDGSAENAGAAGYLKRIADALDIDNQETSTGSLSARLTSAAAVYEKRGAQKLANPGGPFTVTTNISAVGVALSISSGVLVLTAADGSSDRAEWSVSGLTIGNSYEFLIEAEAGVGTSQLLNSFTWGVHPVTTITTRRVYRRVIVATAISGVCRVYAASSGQAGNTLRVHRISVREVL